MFEYSDPSMSNLLSQFGAINNWRAKLEMEYREGAKLKDSAFTWIEAILDLPDNKRAEATIEWKAFPILAQGNADQIDADRRLQEEYVEWAVFRDNQGRVDEIVFVTEFREYFGVLAGVSPAGIAAAVQMLNPGAAPKTDELYGIPNVDGFPPRARELLFLRNLPGNPWNNGEKGILALSAGPNSMPALFGLAAPCGVERPGVPANQVCAPNFCVPGRQSDPQICAACQQLARNDRSFSLVDPIGIFIKQLTGIWKVGGEQIAINDPGNNKDRWSVGRNGRRARLKVGGNERLMLDDDEIKTGTQVADKLFVAATVASALNADLPEWARRGKEETELRVARA